MKLELKQIEKDGSGRVVVIPEESEDIWHLYNLVQRGDRITANTVRKVSKETSSGSVSSEKRHLRLTIAVTTVDYDGEANIIRFSGKNRTESPYIKLNQHHTIEVGLNNRIQLSKGRWDSISLDILNEATN
ncbi:Autophagy- protein 9A, partial [Perkinsus olseni]